MSNEPLSRTEAFAPNFHLVNVTTAASYFHVLRRQLVREYRKPLVILSPKGILRLPAASASMQELTEGTSFASVLDDPSLKTPADVEQVVLLSGKMYYDLVKARSESGMDGRIVFIRLEASENSSPCGALADPVPGGYSLPLRRSRIHPRSILERHVGRLGAGGARERRRVGVRAAAPSPARPACVVHRETCDEPGRTGRVRVLSGSASGDSREGLQPLSFGVVAVSLECAIAVICSHPSRARKRLERNSLRTP